MITFPGTGAHIQSGRRGALREAGGRGAGRRQSQIYPAAGPERPYLGQDVTTAKA